MSAVPTEPDPIPVTHWVPPAKAVDFQSRAQALLDDLIAYRAAPGGGGIDWPLKRPDAIRLHPNPWKLPPWGAPDEPRGDWVARSLAPASDTRRVLEALVGIADGSTGRDIAAAAGISPRSLASTLKALAVLGRQVGRRPMWSVRRAGGVNRYTMQPEVREMFIAVLRTPDPLIGT